MWTPSDVDRTTGMKGHVKRAYWYHTSTVQLLFDLDRRPGAADIGLTRGFRIYSWDALDLSVDTINIHLGKGADRTFQTTLTHAKRCSPVYGGALRALFHL